MKLKKYPFHFTLHPYNTNMIQKIHNDYDLGEKYFQFQNFIFLRHIKIIDQIGLNIDKYTKTKLHIKFCHNLKYTFKNKE